MEINVVDEQIDDLVDDLIQYFNERHFDGVQPTFMKYEITEEDIERGKARPPGFPDGESQLGITTTSVTKTIVGTMTTFNYYENSNYIALPPDIIGINKVFQMDDYGSVASSNMFSFKYQLFLNDLYYWGIY